MVFVALLVLLAAPTRVKDSQGCDKGLDAQNELDGEIICTWPNGQKKHEGMYAHGKRVGLAKTWRDDGKLANTEHFVAGVRTGLAESYARQGFIEESCEYKNDKKHGRCKLFGLEGKLREERQYVEGEQRGPFTEFHQNGKVLEKGVIDDTGRPHGVRERFRDDGSRESMVTYNHGQRDGVSKEWFANGKQSNESSWKDDREHGLRKRWYDNGQLAEVTCEQEGKSTLGTNACTGKSGPELVTKSFANGKANETISVRDGKRNGESLRFSQDGVPREVTLYVDDKRDGVQTLYGQTGKVERKVKWKAGTRDGVETVFFEDGKVSEEIGWKDGRKVSLATWWMNGKKKLEEGEGKRATFFDNGQPHSEEQFESSREQRDGLQRYWAENGKLVEESTWKRGKADGVQKSFDEKTGKLRVEELWAAGVRTSRKEWDEGGAVVKDEQFNADGSRK